MGLVQYDSSDEDEDEQMQIEAQPEVRILSLLFGRSPKQGKSLTLCST